MSKPRQKLFTLVVLMIVPMMALSQRTISGGQRGGTKSTTSAVPTIGAYSPTTGTAGAATFTLTVNGTNYVAGSTTVVWTGPASSNIAATVNSTGTSLTAAIPASLVATAGSASFYVSVAGRNGGNSNAVSFTINPSTTTTPTPTTTTTTPLSITTTSLPAGTAGTAYSATLGASGGTSPYTWSASTALPAGLTLASSGAISGTPTTQGTYSFSAQVKDTASATASYTYSVAIGASTTTATPSITTTSIPNGTSGAAYSATLNASGGVSPYTWSITSYSSMPGGLDVTSAGVLQGTTTQSGTFSCPVQVKDSAGSTSSKTFSFSIGSSTTTASTTSTTTTLAVSTASVPNGTAGTTYPTTTLAAAGGTSPYTWNLASGSVLPAGLALSSAGTISGTPTTPATYLFSVQAIDSANNTATKSYSMIVAAATTTATSTPTGPVFTWSASGCSLLDNTHLCGWSANPNGTGWHLGQDPVTGSPVMAKQFNCGTPPCSDINYETIAQLPDPGPSALYVSGNVYIAQPATGAILAAQRKLYYLRAQCSTCAQSDWWVFLKLESANPMQLAFDAWSGSVENAAWGFSTALNFNTWYNIGIAVKGNTPGASDGFIRVYVNGQLVPDLDKENISTRGNFTSGLSQILVGDQLQGYNSSTDTYNEWRYWNNIVMTTTLP